MRTLAFLIFTIMTGLCFANMRPSQSEMKDIIAIANTMHSSSHVLLQYADVLSKSSFSESQEREFMTLKSGILEILTLIKKKEERLIFKLRHLSLKSKKYEWKHGYFDLNDPEIEVKVSLKGQFQISSNEGRFLINESSFIHDAMEEFDGKLYQFTKRSFKSFESFEKSRESLLSSLGYHEDDLLGPHWTFDLYKFVEKLSIP